MSEQWRETEFGKIPLAWEITNGEEFSIKVTDGTHDSPKRQKEGNFLITSKHIKGRNIDFENAYRISDEDYKKVNKRSKVDQWDVIISMIGEYCGFSYVERNYHINYAIKNVGLFKTGDKIKALWLHYFLQSNIGQYILSFNKSGSSQPYISLSALRQLPIIIPDNYDEQKNIVAILSSLDDKIDLLHRQNKTLEAMAETLFREWFVEGKGEDLSLLDFIEINPRLSMKKGEKAPYLEMKNVQSDSANPSDWYDREFNSGTKFQNGDTLLARITPCLQNGKTAYVQFLKENQIGWGSTEYLVFRTKEPYPKFCSYLLAKNESFRNFAIKTMTGSSGRQRVQTDSLKYFSLKRPKPEQLKIISTQIKPIEEKIKLNAIQIRTLENLRDTLLPKLMSGKVRVKY